MVPEEYVLEIKESSLAGNKFQMNLINELKKECTVDIASFIAVPMTEEQIKKIDNYNDNNKNDRYFYKGNNFVKNLKKYRKYIKKVINNYDFVMTYNVQYPWFGLNKICKNKSILILADFSDTKSYSNYIYKIYAQICKNEIKKYDYVIGLSKNHKKFLKNKQKFMYMPGGVKLNSYEKIEINPVHNKKIKIMYAGLLSKVTGIDMIINVAKRMENVDLIITGRGDLEEFVKEESNNSCNIKYLGSLKYEEYIKALNDANILINPRNMNLDENKNNFPSKIFDYLAVGKIIVSTKFSGYEDFIDNCYFADSNENSIEQALKTAIEQYDENYEKIYIKNI